MKTTSIAELRQAAIDDFVNTLNKRLEIKARAGNTGKEILLCCPVGTTNFVRQQILPLYKDSGVDLYVEEDFEYTDQHILPNNDKSFIGTKWTVIGCQAFDLS